VHENLPLAGLGHVNHLLDHVVGVLVLHHDVQGGGGTVAVHRTYLERGAVERLDS
jgi:hypothetical protein